MKTLKVEPKKLLYFYTVAGSGWFPVDMLRYDGAWPASSNDLELGNGEYRKVELRSYAPPTEARWKSFGWVVLP